MDPRLSRAYGALAGLALGDALGMPTQAMSPQQIRTVYGLSLIHISEPTRRS